MTAIQSNTPAPTKQRLPSRASSPKVVDLEALPALLEPLRIDGKRVALCHGVFDLLHIGHIRYLTEAKDQADILVVTVTEDCHVNKGPHRPAFREGLRCEALAALDVVDFVAINRGSLALAAIDVVRPDVYVKGPDYADAADDITGGIAVEARAVKALGGIVHFTRGETFSSSHLLNRHTVAFDPHVEQYLEVFRSQHSLSDVKDAIKALRDLRMLVVGEAILDEYVYCEQMGKSAKEPVLAMRYKGKELHAGGSLAVANHLAGFCRSVELVTYLGDRDGHEEFVRRSLLSNVAANILYKTDSPTIVKRRYVESYLLSKLFETYIINDELLNPEQNATLCEFLRQHAADCDATVVADFGHGLMTTSAVDILTSGPGFLAVNTQMNAANIGFHAISKYTRADYICIHEGEIRLDARSRRGPLSDLAASLRGRLDCGTILVTQGKAGCSLFSDGVEVASPAFTGNVVDRIGSGDAVLAITSGLVATGAHPEIIAFLANVIGALKLQIMGNRSSVGHISAIKFVESLLK
jgi:rfaE bifunctional protein nucleotidyltransferase chain/domain